MLCLDFKGGLRGETILLLHCGLAPLREEIAAVATAFALETVVGLHASPVLAANFEEGLCDLAERTDAYRVH